MSTLAILGAGGHGEVVADAALCSGRWTDIVWFDDDLSRTPFGSDRVSGPVAAFGESRTGSEVAFGIGSGEGRRALFENLGTRFVVKTVVHPSASVSPRARLGEGVVVLAGAVVNVGAVLSRGVIVNTGSSVDHHCHVGRYAHICPGARLAGNVRVGEGSWIGMGASIIEGVSIGAGVTVGAGSAVIGDLPDGVLAVGVPARIVRRGRLLGRDHKESTGK